VSGSEEVWVVSACLLGERCRYDGAAARDDAQARARGLSGRLIPVCPEELGGLGTPRPAANLDGGDGAAVLLGAARVITEAGVDVTAGFLAGAHEAMQIAKQAGATAACLKARSPSCGVGRTHSTAGLIDGDGVFAATARRAGLRVLSDEDLAEEVLAS
jgi:uncharacterized protein YbbK (DUF523 family)